MDGHANGAAVVMRDVGRTVSNARSGDQVVRLLEGISLHVEAGRRLHIVGPSGAGKSTLVRLVNRLDEASEGELSVLGRPIRDWPMRQLRQQVAMVFQEPSLVGLDVRANLRLPFQLAGQTPGDLEEKMAAALELAGLDAGILDRHADQLSLGQKQRVTLARALIAQPRVLLLDEPTSSLDPHSAAALLESVAQVSEQHGLTVMMVTHRLSEARRMGGDLAVLIDGRIRASGPVEQVIADAGDDQARIFLRGVGNDVD